MLTGKPLNELAADLGVGKSTLINWKDRYLVEMAQEPSDVKGLAWKDWCKNAF